MDLRHAGAAVPVGAPCPPDPPCISTCASFSCCPGVCFYVLGAHKNPPPPHTHTPTHPSPQFLGGAVCATVSGCAGFGPPLAAQGFSGDLECALLLEWPHVRACVCTYLRMKLNSKRGTAEHLRFRNFIQTGSHSYRHLWQLKRRWCRAVTVCLAIP